jgi:hypothetical protein
MLGDYYELSYHDYTQPTICGCMTSRKTMNSQTKINDNFTIRCPAPPRSGKDYPNSLSFNITDTPGHFLGHWPITKDLIFPDTVVDFAVSVDKNGKEFYKWVIEF